MSSSRSSTTRDPTSEEFRGASSEPVLSKLVYRNRAVAPFDRAEKILFRTPDTEGWERSVPGAGNTSRGRLVKELITQVAIPRLIAWHGPVLAPLPVPGRRAAELVGLLIAADPNEAFELVSRLHAEVDSLGALCASVLEPAARGLGDLWSSDDCSEVDVTIGVCRLQSALRRTNLNTRPLMLDQRKAGTILVAPLPGEMHLLGSALDSEVLWEAGWKTQCAFPATDKALQDLLAATWFDAVALSLSPAMRRGHRLARMTRTIELARKASRNPAVRVVVGGRAFFDPSDAARQVGADAASRSSGQVAALIRRSLATDTASR